MWSVGCIFAELLQTEALFPGRGEIDQINRVCFTALGDVVLTGQIFSLLGQPNEDVWPGYDQLPLVKKLNPVGPPSAALLYVRASLTRQILDSPPEIQGALFGRTGSSFRLAMV